MDEDVVRALGGGPASGHSQVQPDTQASSSSAQRQPTVTTFAIHNNTKNNRITFDPSKPLFFPTSSDSSDSSANTPPTILTYFISRSLDSGFCRTQSSEEIKAQWESRKAELTSTWKKAWRNASKKGRRGGHIEG